MEKEIVEENGVIKEELYQRIKNNMNKKNDFYSQKELEQFTDIYRNLGEI